MTRSDLVWHFRLLWLRTVWFGRFVSSEHIRFWPFLAICELLRFGWYKFPMLLQQVWFGSLVSGLVWPKFLMLLPLVWFGSLVSGLVWPKFLMLLPLVWFGSLVSGLVWPKCPMLLQLVWFGSLVSGLVWPKCQLAWRDDKYCTTGEHAIPSLSNRSGEKI